MKKILFAGSTAVLLSFSHHAFASGYQLFEQNAINIEDLGAGGAAIAIDASTSISTLQA